MITSRMTLDTVNDANFWAGDILEGTEYGDSEKSTLSDWIWNNKPEIGCTLEEHPISSMDMQDISEIVEEKISN